MGTIVRAPVGLRVNAEAIRAGDVKHLFPMFAVFQPSFYELKSLQRRPVRVSNGPHQECRDLVLPLKIFISRQHLLEACRHFVFQISGFTRITDDIKESPLAITQWRKAGARFEANTAFRDLFATHTVVDAEKRFVTGQNQNSGQATAQAMLALLADRR